MKKIPLALVCILLAGVVIFLLGAFIAMEMDPRKWGEAGSLGRFFVVGIWVIASLIICAILKGNE